MPLNAPVVILAVACGVICALAGWYVWHENGVEDRIEAQTTAFQSLTIQRMDAIDKVHQSGIKHLEAIDANTANSNRMMERVLRIYCTTTVPPPCNPDGSPK